MIIIYWIDYGEKSSLTQSIRVAFHELEFDFDFTIFQEIAHILIADSAESVLSGGSQSLLILFTRLHLPYIRSEGERGSIISNWGGSDPAKFLSDFSRILDPDGE